MTDEEIRNAKLERRVNTLVKTAVKNLLAASDKEETYTLDELLPGEVLDDETRESVEKKLRDMKPIGVKTEHFDDGARWTIPGKEAAKLVRSFYP